MLTLKKNALIALILLPAFFLLHNYNEIFGFIAVKQILIDVVIIYCFLVIVFYACLRLGLTFSKTALVLFLLTFFILFFGPVNTLFRTIRIFNFNSDYLVSPLYLLLFILLIRKVIKTNNISSQIFFFLNIAVLCLFLTDVGAFVVNWSNVKETNNLIYANKTLSTNYIKQNIPDSLKPDIYFFVFDEYTNNKTLKKVWNFDNDSIANWLTANGFHLPANPSANYSYTVFSVSSTFNMNYIDPKKGGDGTVAKNVLQANESLSDNETFSILKKENYNIHFFAPFNNKIQQGNLGHFFDYIGQKQIQKQTLPGFLFDSKIWNLISGKLFKDNTSSDYDRSLKEKYQLIRTTVDEVKSTTDSSTNRKPNFVYGHIMVPHEPHLFNSEGKFLSYSEFSKATPFDTYTSQIKYANSLIKEIVSYIKQHNKRNTIIIIEGDHGFRSFVNGTNWFARTPDSLKNNYFLPNFNAIYFPDSNYSKVYDHISPINTFRIVFDQFYNQNFPMLKDTGTCVKDTFY